MINKRVLIFGLLVLTFCISGVWAQKSHILSNRIKWVEYKHSTGMSVLLQQDRSRKDISIEFWLHTGTAAEEPDQYGLAHFFEHATPYGLQNDSTLRRDLLDNMNFSNAQTRPDFTRYHIQVKPEVFELGLRYVSDRLKADTLAITKEWVERHRKNVLREFDRQTSTPFWGGTQRAVRAAGIFGEEHPYGHSGYGTRENNENFTVSDFRKWYDQYVFAENITLFIIGNFEISETSDLIDRYFNDIHTKNKFEKPNPDVPNQKKVKEIIEAPTENHTSLMGWAMPAFGSDDDPGIHILSTILNERLSNENNWTGSVSGTGVSANLYRMAGELYISATFSALSDSLEVEKYLKEHLQNMLTDGVSSEEIQRAFDAELEYVQGALNNERMGMWSSRTSLLGEGLLFKGDPGYYLKRLQKQKELQPKDIQQVAEKWLGKEPFQLLIVSDTETDNE